MNSIQYKIQLAHSNELYLLLEIEKRAGCRFDDYPELAEVPDDITPIQELEEAEKSKLVWVGLTSQKIIGFAYATLIDGNCHLEELSVLPEFGRKGVGTALLDHVYIYAKEVGLTGVTLTTYRDIPWNGPFYLKQGFEILSNNSLSPGLRNAFEDEERRGLPIHLRIVMRKKV